MIRAFILQSLYSCSYGLFGSEKSALLCVAPPAVLSDWIPVSPRSSPFIEDLVNGSTCESPATSRWPRRDWHAKKRSSCEEKWEFRSSVRNPLTIQQFFSSNPNHPCYPLYALLTTATTGWTWQAPAPDPHQNEAEPQWSSFFASAHESDQSRSEFPKISRLIETPFAFIYAIVVDGDC